MPNQIEWIKVVTDPIGIAGFALFLVFTVLARSKNTEERRWLAPVFVLLAVVSLVGGLVIAYITKTAGNNPPSPTSTTTPSVSVQGDIHVETHGDQSPGVGVNFGAVNSGVPPAESTPKPTDEKAADAKK